MEQILIVILLSALFALLGRNRKIGYGWSFVLCLFLSTLIGLIITLCSKKKDVEFVEVENRHNEH
jgi:hypothetical protein